VKVLFKEIRHGDIAAVTARLDAKPELVHATATAPPKKDDGQSTLQVAIKSSNFPIAHLLLERGADVDFVEASGVNRWNAPVLHDAIRAAMFNTRWTKEWTGPGEPPHYVWVTTLEGFESAFAVLQALLERGADPNKQDSFGNPPLMRALLDTRQIDGRPDQPREFDDDVHRVFRALRDAGADPTWVDPRSGKTPAEQYEGEPVGRFLRDL